jgi:hypothetical protein
MATGLDSWLKQATRKLAKDSVTQVRTEITEHYESALDAAIANGATSQHAHKSALDALGDAKTANCQYQRVLLTSAEARMLREGNWEASALCSRPWLKWLLPVPPALALALFLTGQLAVARDVFVCCIGMGPLLLAPFLPIRTRARGRVFRLVKWLALTTALALLFGPQALKWSWLLISCLWPLAWTEWRRASIRRKLPLASWPKHLYF